MIINSRLLLNYDFGLSTIGVSKTQYLVLGTNPLFRYACILPYTNILFYSMLLYLYYTTY